MKDNLKLIGIFHLVLGTLGVIFSLFPLLHVLIGVMILSGKEPFDGAGEPPEMPPEAFGYIFIAMGSALVIFGEICSILMLVSGVYILKLKNRMFSMVIGGIECMVFPFGTILGVFTLVNLSNDEVKQLYGEN